MRENVSSFWNEIQLALANYWQSFLHVLPRIVFGILLFLIAVFIALQISKLARRRLTSKAHDPLFGQFVANGIKYSLLICCFILLLHVMGLTGIAGGLLAGAGISALIFGFAFKDIAENFLAGVILAFDRPFRLDDTIRIGEFTGHVKTLNFRTTHIKTFDEKDVYIPNGKLIKETLINMTKDGMIRMDFSVGIAYEDNAPQAAELICKTVQTIDGVMTEHKPFTVVEDLGVSTVNIRVYFWTRTDDYKKGALITKSNVIEKVKRVLGEQGYTLPANIQEIKLYDKRKSIPVEVLGT